MTQDTRKDPRAKIVSLNVRYKSATVDEFIDNHSHDVSKGGIFIKTPSPFPPGTLLKFEIRIAGDKAVIAGVGRVVWKRETAQSNSPEQPAGMGVKFIKIDDPSRAIIDRLVDTKGGARSAYDEGGGDSSIAPPAAHEPATPATPATAPVAKEIRKGGAPPAAGPQAPKPAPAVASRAPAPQPKPQISPARGASLGPTKAGKPTMMGLGSVAASITGGKSLSVPTPAAGRPAGDDARRHTPHGMGVPRPGGSGRPGAAPASGNDAAMFPKTNSRGDMPPTGEQTVMKQAAELLEEALRGAGGSMEEIGQNPLFDQVSSKAKEAEALAKLKQPTATEHPDVQGPGPVDVDDLMKPIAELEEGVAAERARRSSAPPATSHPKVQVPTATAPTAPPASVRPPSAVAAVEDAPPKNKWLLPVLLVAAVGGIGFFAYTEMHAAPADTSTPTPPPSAAASAAPSAPPPAPVPAAAVSAEPAATGEVDATAATPDASSADAAKSAATVSATPAAPVAPAYHPPPRKPVPAATAPPPPPETDETDPIPPPTPTESTHTTPAPTTATPAAGAPSPAATASAPKPSTSKPGTKPKADDDNPY